MIGNIGDFYPARQAPAQTLRADLILNKLMPKLSLSDCAAMARVCKQWNKILHSKLEEKMLSDVVFGKKKWEQIPGIDDVGLEPVLTEDQKTRLVARLKGLCPFFNEVDKIQEHRFQDGKVKRMWQTCAVILFPETINGNPRTVDHSGRVFRFEKEGDSEDVLAKTYPLPHGDEFGRYIPAQKSYFAIVTKDVIPGSRQFTNRDKAQLVIKENFRMPEAVNEALTTVLILNLEASRKKKDYYFGRSGRWYTYTGTKEKAIQCNFTMVVGGAGKDGIFVNIYTFENEDRIGFAAVLEVL